MAGIEDNASAGLTNYAVFMFHAEKEVAFVPLSYLNKEQSACAWPLNCADFLQFKAIVKRCPNPDTENWEFFPGKTIRSNLSLEEAKYVCMKSRNQLRALKDSRKGGESDFSFQSSGNEDVAEGAHITRRAKKVLSDLPPSKKVRTEILPAPPPPKKSKTQDNTACLVIPEVGEALAADDSNKIGENITSPAEDGFLSTSLTAVPCQLETNRIMEGTDNKLIELTQEENIAQEDLTNDVDSSICRDETASVFPMREKDFQNMVSKNFDFVRKKLVATELSLQSLYVKLESLQVSQPATQTDACAEPAESDTYGLELPLKSPESFFEMEKNLEEKKYHEKLVKATVKHIKQIGLKLTGSLDRKVKKCIEYIIMPWFFAPSLVKVSSKAGQGKKNVVKIADTNFISMVVDSINKLAGEGVTNKEMVEMLVGEYLRRAGSKLRQGEKEESKEIRRATFSPHKKTPLKKASRNSQHKDSPRASPCKQQKSSTVGSKEIRSGSSSELDASVSDFSTNQSEDEVYISESDLL